MDLALHLCNYESSQRIDLLQEPRYQVNFLIFARLISSSLTQTACEMCVTHD